MINTNHECVAVDHNVPVDHVVTVTIDRPDARNALNDQTRTELINVLETLEDDEDTRVVILTGSDKSKSFVAGADITEFEDRTAVEQRAASKRPRVYETVDDLSLPVIARIDGFALGGGCELALASDIRIATERSKIGTPEINLGILPGGGGTQRLPRLVGEGQAMRMVLSGEFVDAPEAKDIGLVDEVHAHDDLDDRISDLAGRIAEKSPIALELGKKAIKAASRMGLEEGIEYEAELFAVLFGTEDRKEGVEAFLEDRDPEFTGE